MSSEAETLEEEVQYAPMKANAFALLNGSESESDQDVPEEVPVPRPEPSVPKTNGKPEKRSGRSKKKVRKSAPLGDSADSDDLDRYLEEIRKKYEHSAAKTARSLSEATEDNTHDEEDPELPYTETEPPVAYTDANFLFFTTARLKSCMRLLSVGSVKNLDPDTEFLNLFGSLSLESIEDANSTTSLAASPEVLAQFKKLARQMRGWGGKDYRSVPGTSRKLLLTRIKDDWLPTTHKMLQMNDLTIQQAVDTKYYKEEDAEYHVLHNKVKAEEKLGIRYFQFSKPMTVSDRVANTQFYANVVITPNPEALMTLLQLHPYHIENLLQVAMVMLRQGNNKATSNALIEKALFVFDRCFGKRFHELLQNGQTELIRLPYERFMNRQFYLALFRIIIGLGERSTFFTALCYCKFLLALSPAEDPLGVRYFIDHYAILSEEYRYLVDLVDSPLVQTYSQWYTPGLAFSNVLALLHLGRNDNAREALNKAVDAHPFCASELLQRVCGSSYALISDPTESIALAAETYLIRAALLWKEQSHIEFLRIETIKLIGKKTAGQSWILKWFKGKGTEETPLPVNLLRFVLLSGENKVLAKVPHKVFDMEDTNEFDVLPPRDLSVPYDVFQGASLERVTDHLLDYMDHNLLGAVVAQGTAQYEDFEDAEEPQE